MELAERQARWQALWATIENRSPVVWGRTFVASLLRATSPAPENVRSVIAVGEEMIRGRQLPQRMPADFDTVIDPRHGVQRPLHRQRIQRPRRYDERPGRHHAPAENLPLRHPRPPPQRLEQNPIILARNQLL